MKTKLVPQGIFWSENLAKNSIDAEYLYRVLQDKCSVGAVGVWYIEKYRQNMQSGASLGMIDRW